MTQNYIQSNVSLYLMHLAEACNELAGPISTSLQMQATQLLSKKCRSGGEPLATLCPIRPARYLSLRPPSSETNMRLLSRHQESLPP